MHGEHVVGYASRWRKCKESGKLGRALHEGRDMCASTTGNRL